MILGAVAAENLVESIGAKKNVTIHYRSTVMTTASLYGYSGGLGETDRKIWNGDGNVSGAGEQDSREMTLKKQGFYQKAAWRRVRRQALERDHYLCQECLRHKHFTRATEVHHKKPAEEYPELALTLSNLESLCWDCHEQTKRRVASDTGPKAPSGVRVIKI